MHQLAQPDWIAIAAHRLQHRWRSINPGQFDDVASELWNDARLRELEPVVAVDVWLAPILTPDAPPR